MGNHDAGRAMVLAVETAMKFAPDADPMEVLDQACTPYRGADAEFDDDCHPSTVFGHVLTRAFLPDYDPAADEDGEIWFDRVYMALKDRYGLC